MGQIVSLCEENGAFVVFALTRLELSKALGLLAAAAAALAVHTLTPDNCSNVGKTGQISCVGVLRSDESALIASEFARLKAAIGPRTPPSDA